MNLYKIREDLHRIPEIGFDVFKTKDYILNLFKGEEKLDIKVLDFNAIIMVYSGDKEDSEYRLFRADMDALPIVEKTGVSFISQHKNAMHACGHDVHMTILIGLMDKVLRNNLSKNLIFVFQPGEEGHGGAEHVIKSGILDSYKIKECFALHVSGNMPVGTVSCKAGIEFGIPQEFDVIFKGKTAHIAKPQYGKDALLAGIQFYTSMKQLIPQSIDPTDPVVFQIGKCEAGVVRNAIAERCHFQGTHRTLTKANREEVNQIMKRVAKGIADAHDLAVDVQLLATFDAVVNDEELFGEFKSLIQSSEYNFEPCDYTMVGEDFGYFCTYYKSLLFWLGTGDMENNLHHDTFLPKKETIDAGVDIMWRLLNR